MASRFYMENTVVQSSGVTAVDGTWTDDERTAQGIPGRTFKLIPSGTIPVTTSYSTPAGQPSLTVPPNRYTMHVMYEYTLPAGLLITGTVRAELAGFRQNNSNNVSRSIAAHIRNGGTHKATVVQAFSATNFYGFTPGHVQALLATPIVDDGYITVAGDVLYLEVGLGWAAIASDCNVTVGYNNANADWPDGADGTVDTSPTVKNPWFEFTTTLAAAPSADDFLMTLSATSTAARPSSPSKPGLHFFDRTALTDYRWTGTSWVAMLAGISGMSGGIIGFSDSYDIDVTLTGSTASWNANALSLSGARTKTLTLSDDAIYGALLKSANTFGISSIALSAHGSTSAFVISPEGFMGRDTASRFALMFHGLIGLSSNSRFIGWDLQGLNSTGIGGVQMIRGTLNDTTPTTSTAEIIGIHIQTKSNSAQAQGAHSIFRAEVVAPAGSTSTTRGALRPFRAKMPSSLTGQTFASASWFECESGLNVALGGLPGANIGFSQPTTFALGSIRRGSLVQNSHESTRHLISGTTGFGVILFDTADNIYYQLTLKSGVIGVSALGSTTPTI